MDVSDNYPDWIEETRHTPGSPVCDDEWCCEKCGEGQYDCKCCEICGELGEDCECHCRECFNLKDDCKCDEE